MFTPPQIGSILLRGYFYKGDSLKAILQRVKKAEVCVEGEVINSIDRGFLILLCVERNDSEQDIEYVCKKISHMRIFPNDQGKFHYSIKDVNGEILVVSQFTLAADINSGRRPSFNDAAPPDIALSHCNKLISILQKNDINTKSGQFGANMQVSLINDGPVSIIIDTNKKD